MKVLLLSVFCWLLPARLSNRLPVGFCPLDPVEGLAVLLGLGLDPPLPNWVVLLEFDPPDGVLGRLGEVEDLLEELPEPKLRLPEELPLVLLLVELEGELRPEE